MLGTVKWFNPNKGYGFIVIENGKEYFVHWRAIVTKSPNEMKILNQGEPVSFDFMETDKGIQAINVMRLDPNQI